MRAVVQRVRRAEVSVGAEVVGKIDHGLCVLIAVGRNDVDGDASVLAKKIAGLRIFEDDEGKMNRDVADVGGAVLAISQFTLFGDARKGRRPSFGQAMEPEEANRLFQLCCDLCRHEGIEVATGRFREHMVVVLENDGPVTILLDTHKAF